jgi:ribosome-binding protein aMBF1 (putative translation factor)
MTTIQNIQSLREFSRNTTSSGSLFLTPKQQPIASDGGWPAVVTIDCAPLTVSKEREGRIPRSLAKTMRESKDPAYRERANAARQALSEELTSVMPETLAILRLRLGMSQHDLAKKMRTSQPHIANIEAGKVQLYLETAGRLADSLNISLDRLRQLIAIEQPAKTTVGAEL